MGGVGGLGLALGGQSEGNLALSGGGGGKEGLEAGQEGVVRLVGGVGIGVVAGVWHSWLWLAVAGVLQRRSMLGTPRVGAPLRQ